MKSILVVFLFNIIIFSQSFINEDLRSKILKENEQDLLTANNFYEASSFNKLDAVSWKKLNGPYGGYITAIETRGDTILVGTGVYKTSIFYSVDGGKNWAQANFIKLEQVNDFIFTNDNAVLACSDARTKPNSGGNIYKSYDLVNWDPIPYNGYEYWSLGKDLDGNLYAGTDESLIFYSSNNGNDWKGVFPISGRIWNFLTLPDGDMIAGRNGSYIRKNKDSLPSNWSTNYINIQQHTMPFLDDSNHFYLATGQYLFSTIDDGATWVQKNTGTFFKGNSMYDCEFNKRFIGAFENTAYVGGIGWGAAISDNGSDWRWSQDGLPNGISSYKVAKSGNETYLGTLGAGLFKSTDFGESWFSSSKGISSASTRDFAVFDDSMMYAAVWNVGLVKSIDGGNNWENLNNKLNNIQTLTLTLDQDSVFFVGTTTGIYKSMNKGESWIKTSVAGNDFSYWLVSDKNKLYSINYYGGIWVTNNKGASWSRIDNNFNSSNIFGFSIDEHGRLYAGTTKGFIYRSNNEGLTWVQLKGESTANTAITYIQTASNGNIFATSNTEGLLKSTDDGLTWQVVDIGITDPLLGAMIVTNSDEIFLNLKDKGIIYSSNYGNSWYDITSEAEKLLVNKFVQDKKNTLFMATDQSIWKLDKLVITSNDESENLTSNYSLSQNYPNPFNPSTTIKYSIPERSMVTIKVFDLLGREIRTLINEEKQTGSYEVTFNAAGLPSGIYFYSIHAGKFSETRKMLLVK